MEQKMEAKEFYWKKSLWSFVTVLVIFGMIQFDAVASMIPNQIVGMAVTPVVWGIGAIYILIKTKKRNIENALYNNFSFSSRDCLTLFFVIAGGITMAVSNYLYAGLTPLFFREFFTGYPLYTIRNIVYYPLEVLLMLELLIYSQKAGETLSKKISFPWGAIVLFLLWGLPHILWHGFSDGIVSALRAFIYSIPFYTSNKNLKVSYSSMLILWFL